MINTYIVKFEGDEHLREFLAYSEEDAIIIAKAERIRENMFKTNYSSEVIEYVQHSMRSYIRKYPQIQIDGKSI